MEDYDSSGDFEAAREAFLAQEDGADSQSSESQVEPSGDETQSTEASDYESFYDASKVPAELQPTFKELQAAFTKKTQEVAPWRKLQDLGMTADEAYQAIADMKNPDKTIDNWIAMSRQVGLSDEQIIALFQDEQEVVTPANVQQPESGPDSRYMTVEQFQSWQYQQEQDKAMATENKKIADTIKRLEIPAEIEHLAIAAALKQPEHLDSARRLELGWDSIKKWKEAEIASVRSKDEINDARTPAPLGGGAPPMASTDAPKDWKEGRNAALSYLKALKNAD